MILKKVQMTWDKVSDLPSPLKFSKGAVRVNRFDPTRVYFEFSGIESSSLRNLYSQIKVWLLNARCISIQFTYEGKLPVSELKRLKFTPSGDKIWRKEDTLLKIAAIPVVNSGNWILSIENRTGNLGVPVDACDLNSLFSFQLRIDMNGEVVSS